MTLNERIKQLEEKKRLYDAGRTTQSQIKDLEQLLLHLPNAEKSLKYSSSLYESLRRNMELQPYDVSAIKRSVGKIKTGLRNDTFDYTETRLLERECKSAKDKADEYWNEYVESQIASAKAITGWFGSMLDGNKIYENMKDIEGQLKLAVHGSDDAYRLIYSYRNHYRELMDTLHLSESMLKFFQTLNEKNSISLADLDYETLKELKESTFASNLAISTQ